MKIPVRIIRIGVTRDGFGTYCFVKIIRHDGACRSTATRRRAAVYGGVSHASFVRAQRAQAMLRVPWHT